LGLLFATVAGGTLLKQNHCHSAILPFYFGLHNSFFMGNGPTFLQVYRDFPVLLFYLFHIVLPTYNL
jgi:hypothetical protein